MKNVQIKNSEENPIPTEVIAESIVTISEGIKKLRSGRLNDKAIFLLIQKSCTGSIGISEIRAVIDAMESLEAMYLKKPGKA